MALIRCPECGQEISDRAPSCPKCGFPLTDDRNSEAEKPAIEATEDETAKLDDDAVSADDPDTGEKKKNKKRRKGLKVFLIVFASVVGTLVCGAAIFYFVHTHSFNDWVVTKHATCTESGERYHQCKLCFQKFSETIDPISHSWVDATCTTSKKCTRCGKTEGSALGHSWKSATCTTAKKCTRCGKTEGSALGHNYVDYICTRCKDCNVSRSDMPNILDIYNPRYNINSVNGIDEWMTFYNKSSTKTIKYITIELEFINAVGDVLKNEIGSDKSAYMSYTGPLGPGASSGEIYWRAVFYNGDFSGTINFKSIEIEYTDGSKLNIDDYAADGAVVAWR